MFYRIPKDQIVVQQDEGTTPTYSVEFVGFDTQYRYLNIEGNTQDFETNNSQAEKIQAVDNAILYDEKMVNKNLNYKNFLKNKVRNRIDKEVGDIYDLLADLDKRVGMIERLVVRFVKTVMDGEDPTQNEKLKAYKPYLDQYIYAVDNGLIIGRNDIEDLDEMFKKIAQRTTTIAEIVKNEYLDKLNQDQGEQ